MRNSVFLPMMAFLLLLHGCAPFTVPANVKVHRPAGSQSVPLRAALYLPQQFKAYAFIGNKGGQPIRILIGDALAAGAERSMREVFKEVVIADNPNLDLAARNISVFVSPEIIEIENRVLGFGWDSLVSIKWTIKGQGGRILYLNTVTGKGRYKAVTTAFSLREHLEKSMIPAVEDHFNKLTAHLLAVKWWN